MQDVMKLLSEEMKSDEAEWFVRRLESLRQNAKKQADMSRRETFITGLRSTCSVYESKMPVIMANIADVQSATHIIGERRCILLRYTWLDGQKTVAWCEVGENEPGSGFIKQGHTGFDDEFETIRQQWGSTSMSIDIIHDVEPLMRRVIRNDSADQSIILDLHTHLLPLALALRKDARSPCGISCERP